MAKSTSFFGLRKGSTKSHTYQVYRGQQVTKDRVTDVANPQSDDQMLQRIKLVGVAGLAAALKGIVDHSWQSVEYGYKSIAEFRRLNLTKNGLTLMSYVPKGYANGGVGDYLLSSGSLQDVNVSTVDAIHYKLGDVTATGLSLTADSDNNIEVTEKNIANLCSMLGIEVGQQLTFILGVTNPTWETDIDDSGNVFFPTRYIVSRLITDIDDEDCLKGWKIDPSTFGMSNGEITNGLISIELPYAETSATTGKIGIAAQGKANGITYGHNPIFKLPSSWGLDDAGNDIGGTDSNGNWLAIQEMAVIRSAKSGSVYQRSRSRFIVNLNDENKEYWTALGIAQPTYLKSSTASTKYLNSGTETVSDTYEA